METVWKIIFIVAVAGFFYLLNYTYKYRTGQIVFEGGEPKGRMLDFVWGLLAAVFFYV